MHAGTEAALVTLFAFIVPINSLPAILGFVKQPGALSVLGVQVSTCQHSFGQPVQDATQGAPLS